LSLFQQLYLKLNDNLQTLQLNRYQNTPSVTIIDPAIPPAEPARPRPVLYLSLAGITGLLLALGVLMVMNFFEDTLKFTSDAEDVLGVPVIGTIPSHSHPMNGPVVARESGSIAAQQFLKVGVALQLANGEKAVKSLMVTSPGKADGKTLIAANLASACSRQGKRVLLIDANSSHPGLHGFLGLNNEQGFFDLLHGGKDIVSQSFSNGDGSSFLFLPAGSSLQPDEALMADNLAQVLNKLHKQADLIILDAPSMVSANSLLLAAHTDGVLFVITSGRTHKDSAENAIQQLKRQGAHILGLVMNRAPDLH